MLATKSSHFLRALSSSQLRVRTENKTSAGDHQASLSWCPGLTFSTTQSDSIIKHQARGITKSIAQIGGHLDYSVALVSRLINISDLRVLSRVLSLSEAGVELQVLTKSCFKRNLCVGPGPGLLRSSLLTNFHFPIKYRDSNLLPVFDTLIKYFPVYFVFSPLRSSDL